MLLIGHLLTYKKMATLVDQVDLCLNSRPLTILLGDIDDIEAVTPGHLLTGYAPRSTPEPRNEVDSSLEYLPHRRWIQSARYFVGAMFKGSRPNGEVDKFVLTLDPSLPRRRPWPVGKVTVVYPRRGGLAGVETVRTASDE